MGTVKAAARSRRTRNPVGRLSADEAFIALLLGAMNANMHVSAEEAERAHHILWSMRRFRRKSGRTVNRIIATVRSLIERHGASPVIEVAARAIPARFRKAAFSVTADLVLVDGRMEPSERRFLERLGKGLRLGPDAVRRIIDVMLVKNSA
jgi:hypothetical protein